MKLQPQDVEKLLAELEHIIQVGHGELNIKVADARIVSWKSQAGWELRENK